MIKAVFFDIDGTLVSFNTHSVPKSTLVALDKLKRNGIKTFIATGRSWGQLKLLEDFPAFDGYILLNGSYCRSAEGEVIYKNLIPRDDLERLVEFHKEHPFPIEFVYADRETMTNANQVVIDAWAHVNIPVPPIVPIEDCPKDEVFQLSFFLNHEQEDELKPVKRFMPGCTSMGWSPVFYDVVPKGSCKSVGIDKIIAHYGIRLDETLAFGDGGNDIDMIKHAAIGVAMGNAGDSVKEAADYVTTTVDEDGILNALIELKIIS